MLKRLWVAVCRSLCNVGKMGWTIEGLFEASIQYVDYTVCICRWVSMYILLHIGKGWKKGLRLNSLCKDNAFIDVAILHATGSLRGSRGHGWDDWSFATFFWDLNLKFCASTLSFVLLLGGAIPVFNRMLNGTDCDQNWSWHVAWPGIMDFLLLFSTLEFWDVEVVLQSFEWVLLWVKS